MSNAKLELTVGLFILLGFAALAFLAFKVSGINVNSGKETYEISAKFENVSGLTERSKVTIAGVIVGQVSKIQYSGKDFLGEVFINMDSEVNNLPIDTSAAILSSGLLGGKYIGLQVGADEDFLIQGDVIEDTQSAIVLEDLIGQFLMSSSSE